MRFQHTALGAFGDAAPSSYVPAPSGLATLHGLPDGPEGTYVTMRAMRNFARASLKTPEQIVRNAALSIVKNVAPRDYWGELKACHAFVRDQIRYTMDPDDIELVQSPEVTLSNSSADCDDKSVLLAALLLSLGHPCRFVAVGFGGEPFSHVLVESKVGDAWVPCETIVPVQLGWYPNGVTSRYILNV